MTAVRKNYRKVYVRIWNDPDFTALPDDLKVMTLYVLTGPQTNRVGLFRFSTALASEQLSCSVRHAQARFERVCGVFGWQIDRQANVVWIKSWWIYNPITANPKNLHGYLADLNNVPKTPLIHKFCHNLEQIPDGLHSLFAPWEKALSVIGQCSITDGISDRSVIEHRSNTVRSTETETETETETSTKTRAAKPRPTSTVIKAGQKTPTRAAFEHYHVRFQGKYKGAKPVYAHEKDAGRMARLLRSTADLPDLQLTEVKRRFDAYFDMPDPFFQEECGHTLDVFFAAGTQTKIIAYLNRARGSTDGPIRPGGVMSVDETQRYLQAFRAEGKPS